MHICKKCNKTSARKSDMKVHINGQHLGVTFNCEKCGKAFRSNSRLLDHTRIEHPEIKIKCPQCPYTTVLISTLNVHLKRVHKQPQPEKSPSQTDLDYQSENQEENDKDKNTQEAVDENAWRNYYELSKVNCKLVGAFCYFI